MLFSCAKDGATDSSLTTDQDLELNLPNNYEDPHLDGEMQSRTDEPECECHYEIISVVMTDPPLGISRAWDLRSNEFCMLPSSCAQFKGKHFSDQNCENDPLPAQCVDYHTSYVPIGKFPFKCEVDEYSTIPLQHLSAFFDENCSVSGSPIESTITFQIWCKKPTKNSACQGGTFYDPIYGWPSGHITLESDLDGISDVYELDLGGPCGCRPQL